MEIHFTHFAASRECHCTGVEWLKMCCCLLFSG